MNGLKPVLITSGDPSGIGPEIALRAWSNGSKNVVLMGNIEHLSSIADASGLVVNFTSFNPEKDVSEKMCSVWELDWQVMPTAGKPNPQNVSVIVNAIEEAAKQVKQEKFSAVVTNPIAKSVLYEDGFQFPGHTEFLAALDSPDNFPVMMLANPYLRVVPLTIHIPLSDVEETITAELFKKTNHVLETALRQYFMCPFPRIAITGLNPHAGEDGHLGRFEIDKLIPLIQAQEHTTASLLGPFSADSLFHAEKHADYDVVLCMYHDQALIPVKTIDFYRTVNITLGLSFIRTSPDHGTAFDRAALFNSHPGSLISAIETAQQMAAAEQKHKNDNIYR